MLLDIQIALYESLLASPHRTTNGDEADFFYVPVLGACAITRADDAPHYDMQVNPNSGHSTALLSHDGKCMNEYMHD